MIPAPPDPAWLAETERRLRINEGYSLTRYLDSRGIWTLGVGYNLQRGDAPQLLKACGIDYSAVMAGRPIEPAQATRLFTACFEPIIGAARASLAPGIYDTLSGPRQFAVCDLNYNLGTEGWLDFSTSRTLLSQAQLSKNAGRMDSAHALFTACADHLAGSDWASQVGNRAKRNIAMVRTGVWVNAEGNGTT